MIEQKLITKAAVAKAVAPAKTGTILSTTKAVLLSPIFGVVVIGGIIAWELWQGKKDAMQFQANK